MHEAVFYLAMIWLAILIVPTIVQIQRARSAGSRILALDTLVLLVIGLLVLWSDSEGVAFFLDAALLLALLAFMGTLATARFYARGWPF